MVVEPNVGLEITKGVGKVLIRFIAARVRKTFHELHLLTPSLLFLPANQVSVGYGDKIRGLNMKMMITKNICT